MDDLRETVRERYAEAARASGAGGGPGGCCDAACTGDAGFGASLYETAGDVAEPLGAALLASLGCGNPTAMIDLRAGETVLDLGSGAGLDVLLSARRVGPSGKAYGLDMTEEMLDLARGNAAEAGVENVEFLQGYIESIPLPDASVDVVISNCVVNLSTDKPAVFSEIARVVRPGGRLAISDVVAQDGLTADDRRERGSYVGCIAGALSFGEYAEALRESGFEDVSVTSTHEVADRMHAAIVRARRSSG